MTFRCMHILGCFVTLLAIVYVEYGAILFQERHSAKTVGEIKEFVSKLPHMQGEKTSLATRKHN